MGSFLGTMKRLGPTRLMLLAGIALSIVGFFAYMTKELTTPEMALLYGDLDFDDSSEVVTKLDSMGVIYELSADSTRILVADSEVQRLRLALAQEGLPRGGSVGYEIFDRSDGFGTSSSVLDINRLRALEGELVRTIRTITSIKAARVHLVMPKRELFSRDRQEPSASIVIKLRGNLSLSKNQVSAIQHLVAAAVPDLQPDRVSVIDDRGNLLARGMSDDESGAPTASNTEELQRAYEDRLSNMIEELVGRTLGADKVRAEVTAEMDFDRITSTAEIYDPDGQVIRSTQNVEEANSDSDGGGQSPVSVGQNLPSVNAESQGAGAQNVSSSSRVEEVVNYEISKTIKSHVREKGVVRRLSVAVLVDGAYEKGADGESIYIPRADAEIAQLTGLVRSAIGYDEARGDQVDVVNMRFAPVDLPAPFDKEVSWLDEFNVRGYIRIAETLVLFVVALLVLLLVVRPIVMRTLAATKPAAKDEGKLLTDESGGQQALPGPDGTMVAASGAADAKSQLSEMMDAKSIEGQMRANSLKTISEIVENHPEEAVSIVRSWLYDKA